MKNKIDYVGIVREAIRITINNKILWWFGFLAIFSGSYLSFNYSFPGKSSDKKFDEMEYMNMLRRISFYWDLYKEWIILGVLVIIFLLIIFYILGLIGRGALINSVFKIIKKETFSFSSGFGKGVYFLGRLFLINLFFSLTFLLAVFILIFPVIRLVILKSYVTAFLLGLVAFLLLISIAILFFYFRRYGEMYLIGNDLSVSNSIKLAYRLFEKNIKESFIMGLVLMIVNLIIGVGLILILLGISVPFGIAGVIFYKIAGKMVVSILGIIVIVAFVGLMTFARSILNVFFETIWVLFFHEIAKRKEDANSVAEKEKNIDLNAEAEPEITL